MKNGRERALLVILGVALACSAALGRWPSPLTGQVEAARSPAASSTADRGVVGDAACAECHAGKSHSYVGTVHHLTSRPADAKTIAGHFGPGKNQMTTFNPQLTFKMEQRDGRFYESATVDRKGHKTTRTEAIDIVIGTATKGQTYLYWKEDLLFELPVSYWTELNRWVNSPGFVDGSADFERPVTARCLECHATYFESVPTAKLGDAFNKDNFVLGISCERCHGPGLAHVRDHRSATAIVASMPPIGFDRERQIDICAQCHGGVGQSTAPPFSFRPGDDLTRTLLLARPQVEQHPDVHGNQVGLLEQSRCFLSSPNLSCSTCHDVHAPEQAAASYSGKCLACHRQEQCGMFAKMGARIAANCIDCHMPVQESRSLVLDVDDARLNAKVRNHRIAIYAK